MVELLVVSSLVVCFVLALLDYVPIKYKSIAKISINPWFRLISSVVVSAVALVLLGVTGSLLVLLVLASSFLAHGVLLIFRKL